MKNVRELLLDGATILAAVCAVALTALVFLRQSTATASSPSAVDEEIDERTWNELSAVGHRIGPENALLVVVEFGDFECPACAAFARTFRRFQQENPRDVALVFRHWPLSYHKFARRAAGASVCAANQGRFAEFHDLLFEKRDSIGLMSFDEFARRAGVPDIESFNSCLSDPLTLAAIERDLNTASALGGRGTPTILVRGRRLGSLPDETGLNGLLDAARAR